MRHKNNDSTTPSRFTIGHLCHNVLSHTKTTTRRHHRDSLWARSTHDGGNNCRVVREIPRKPTTKLIIHEEAKRIIREEAELSMHATGRFGRHFANQTVCRPSQLTPASEEVKQALSQFNTGRASGYGVIPAWTHNCQHVQLCIAKPRTTDIQNSDSEEAAASPTWFSVNAGFVLKHHRVSIEFLAST